MHGVNGLPGRGANKAILRNACGRLQPTCGIARTRVDGSIKDLKARCQRQRIALQPVPEVAPVDGARVIQRQIADVEVRVAAFGDAKLGFAAGVFWMVDVTALVIDEGLECRIEAGNGSGGLHAATVRGGGWCFPLIGLNDSGCDAQGVSDACHPSLCESVLFLVERATGGICLALFLLALGIFLGGI